MRRGSGCAWHARHALASPWSRAEGITAKNVGSDGVAPPQLGAISQAVTGQRLFNEARSEERQQKGILSIGSPLKSSAQGTSSVHPPNGMHAFLIEQVASSQSRAALNQHMESPGNPFPFTQPSNPWSH